MKKLKAMQMISISFNTWIIFVYDSLFLDIVGTFCLVLSFYFIGRTQEQNETIKIIGLYQKLRESDLERINQREEIIITLDKNGDYTDTIKELQIQRELDRILK